jgi:HEAT repeat protein
MSWAEGAPSSTVDAGILAKINGLVQDWETSKNLTSEGAEKLTASLVDLGAAAIPAIVASLEAASERNSVSTGVLTTALVRLNARSASTKLAMLALSTKDQGQKRNYVQALESIGSPEVVVPLLKSVIAATPAELKEVKNRSKLQEFTEIQQMTTKALITMSKQFDNAFALIREIQKQTLTATPETKIKYIGLLQDVPYGWAEDALFPMAFDISSEVSALAIRALGKAGTSKTCPDLVKLLSQDNAQIRTASCFTLGKLKFLPAIPSLIDHLADKDKGVVQTASWALRNISGLQFSADKSAWQTWYEGQLANNAARLAELLEDAKSGAPELKPLAIEQMGTLTLVRDKMFDSLKAFLSSNDAKVRAAACNVLAQSGDQRVLRMLVPLLRDQSELVTHAAWRGLQYFTGKNLPLNVDVWTDAIAGKG